MKTVSIRDAKNRLTELAREVERGETVVVTRNGRPAFDLVPHQARKGLRLEAIDEFKRRHRVRRVVPYIADDFDAPLPEDFLLRPLSGSRLPMPTSAKSTRPASKSSRLILMPSSLVVVHDLDVPGSILTTRRLPARIRQNKGQS